MVACFPLFFLLVYVGGGMGRPFPSSKPQARGLQPCLFRRRPQLLVHQSLVPPAACPVRCLVGHVVVLGTALLAPPNTARPRQIRSPPPGTSYPTKPGRQTNYVPEPRRGHVCRQFHVPCPRGGGGGAHTYTVHAPRGVWSGRAAKCGMGRSLLLKTQRWPPHLRTSWCTCAPCPPTALLAPPAGRGRRGKRTQRAWPRAWSVGGPPSCAWRVCV